LVVEQKNMQFDANEEGVEIAARSRTKAAESIIHCLFASISVFARKLKTKCDFSLQ